MAAFAVFTSKVDAQTVLIQTDVATLGKLILRVAKDVCKIRVPGEYTVDDLAGVRAGVDLIQKALLAYEPADLGLSDEAAQSIQEALVRYEEGVVPMLIVRSRELAG